MKIPGLSVPPVPIAKPMQSPLIKYLMRTGSAVGDTGTNTDDDLTEELGNLMCEDNCRLLTNADVQAQGYVITLQDNDDSRISGDPNLPTPFVAGLPGADNAPLSSPQNPTSFQTEGTNFQTAGIGNVPVTITDKVQTVEYLAHMMSQILPTLQLLMMQRGEPSASITYNEDSYTILVGLSFGSIDIQPIDDEWSSGEEIPIELFDADANQNSRADEDLDLFNTDVSLIPSLETGDTFTLAENDNDDGALLPVVFIDDVTLAVDGAGENAIESTPVIADATNEQSLNMEVQKFSKRGIIDTSDSTVFTYEALFMTLKLQQKTLRKPFRIQQELPRL